MVLAPTKCISCSAQRSNLCRRKSGPNATPSNLPLRVCVKPKPNYSEADYYLKLEKLLAELLDAYGAELH